MVRPDDADERDPEGGRSATSCCTVPAGESPVRIGQTPNIPELDVEGLAARDARARCRADLERLQYLSTRQVEARESWGLTGSQALAKFLCQDADLERKASAIEWLSKSGFYCMKQQDVLGRLPPTGRGGTRAGTPSLTPWRIAAPPVARHTAEVTFRTCPLKQLTSAPAGWRPRAASAILDELCAGGTVPAD